MNDDEVLRTKYVSRIWETAVGAWWCVGERKVAEVERIDSKTSRTEKALRLICTVLWTFRPPLRRCQEMFHGVE